LGVVAGPGPVDTLAQLDERITWLAVSGASRNSTSECYASRRRVEVVRCAFDDPAKSTV
jgi:hypothetical protein